MKVIDVYQQYFAARCVYNGVPRRAASVMLTASSDAGTVRYSVSVSFFPHTAEDDFAVSYDACAEREIYAAPGRRSKKREAALLAGLRPVLEELAAGIGGEIFLDQPLTAARYG